MNMWHNDVEFIIGEVDVNSLYGIQEVDRGTVVVYFREVQRFTLSINNLQSLGAFFSLLYAAVRSRSRTF